MENIKTKSTVKEVSPKHTYCACVEIHKQICIPIAADDAEEARWIANSMYEDGLLDDEAENMDVSIRVCLDEKSDENR